MRYDLWFHTLVLRGDEPATAHLGSVQAYGVDGKAIPDGDLGADAPSLAGWRAGCDCGWRGAQFYPQAEFPRIDGADPHGLPPPAVLGDGTSGAHSDWYDQIYEALPELMVHDMLAAVRSATHPDVRGIVALARDRGATWARIGTVTGLRPHVAEALWGPRTRQMTPPAVQRSARRPVERGTHRPAAGRPARHDPRGRGPQR